MWSRIFWVGIAGIALVAGMVIQDGRSIFHWDDDVSIDRRIDAQIDRAVDRSVEGMQVVRTDGREIPVSAEAKRALIDAVGRLVKAEADLATLRIRDGNDQERQAAIATRDQARADVDRLKEQIRDQEPAAGMERDVRDQVRREIREDVRDTVRDAVRN
jgi:hypothetical protein